MEFVCDRVMKMKIPLCVYRFVLEIGMLSLADEHGDLGSFFLMAGLHTFILLSYVLYCRFVFFVFLACFLQFYCFRIVTIKVN